MAFTGVDFFGLDSLLTEDERLVQSTTRRFVDNRILPTVDRHFDQHTFPAEWVKEMGQLGLLGHFIPEEYGGGGGSYFSYGLVCQELERGDSGIRSFCSVQSSLVMFPIFHFGSEEQKKKWLPQLASGDAIGCFGLTEPDFGSNPSGMRTRAKRSGDSYVLNGTKRWITNADVADICIVWAKGENDEIGAYLVEKGAAGLTQKEIKNKFSLRASHTGELIFEDCAIPLANKLPNSDGLKSALKCLNSARFGIVWGALGAAMACYTCALEYAQSRKQFSRPIAGYQLVQAKLVDMLTEITKGQLLAYHLGRAMDQGTAKHTQVSMGKMNNVSTALHIARVARDILGANGITTEYPVIRHMLNLESVNTYEGTEDIHRLILGLAITGLNAFE